MLAFIGWRVSILVFLEPLLRLFDFRFHLHQIFQFQSLFFWNHCLDFLAIVRLTYGYKFQSLFFWNHCLDQEGWVKIWREIMMFQSLFFWNHCLDNIVAGGFIGLDLFQSLFFWNHCLDLALSDLVNRLILFQSLFFWNHCLDTAFLISSQSPSGFNPCFSGTTA